MFEDWGPSLRTVRVAKDIMRDTRVPSDYRRSDVFPNPRDDTPDSGTRRSWAQAYGCTPIVSTDPRQVHLNPPKL